MMTGGWTLSLGLEAEKWPHPSDASYGGGGGPPTPLLGGRPLRPERKPTPEAKGLTRQLTKSPGGTGPRNSYCCRITRAPWTLWRGEREGGVLVREWSY